MMFVSQAASALGARFTGDDVEFNAVSTDSRSIRRGDLFVALQGEQFDGHSFVAQAAAAGAAAAIVSCATETKLPQIMVEDTTRALGRLGNFWRRQFDIPLVALTGSSGKTTVKEMLAAILREACRTSSPPIPDSQSSVLATRGNLNNHIGVPLTLLELRRQHRYAVVEMGMNHAGELRYITNLAEPDVALINNAGVAHIENLGSTEAIARAKGEIFEGLKNGGVAVFGAEEYYAPLWRELAAGKKQLDFALGTQAAVTASYNVRQHDSELDLKTPLGEARAVVPAPGLLNVRNALAASAAATALAVPTATVAAGLAHFHGVNGRLQYKFSASGAALIDDTYNANPDSVRAAIAVLAQVPGRRLLVLGDMGELGRDAAAMHAQVGEEARRAGIDRLLTLGELSAHASRSFGAAARHFTRIEDLLAEIEHTLAPEVTLLVKGSRFMRMERVVAAFAVDRKAGGDKLERTIQ